MKRNRFALVLASALVFLNSYDLFSFHPRVTNSGEIKIALEKLRVLGSVLYIAAHPDDENTAILSWSGSEKLMRTGYLSLTRGGGGQNLIGPEKGSLLSVLRTFELMAARQIDGAEQFFTGAVDFGYSKTAEESIAIWGKEQVLGDLVFLVRKFKPDIILCRFPPQSGGHGHHTASAILAIEAFRAAGDPSRFPEQLTHVSVWTPRRIFWNSWLPRMKDVNPQDLKDLIFVDVGRYNPIIGMSYTEIAALSRSMHKSQGFGVLARRGQLLDYFQLLKGEPAKHDLFEGIDTSWRRIPGSESVDQLLAHSVQEFVPDQPGHVVPILIKALTEMEKLPRSHWIEQKERELLTLIRHACGLWMEAISPVEEISARQEIVVLTTVINRSDIDVVLKEVEAPGGSIPIRLDQKLENNLPFSTEFPFKAGDVEFSQPYWLKKKPGPGFYRCDDYRLKGLPLAPYPFVIRFVVEICNRRIVFETPVLYRYRDRTEGEQYRLLVAGPPVSLNFFDEVVYFPDQSVRPVRMTLRSGPAPVSGQLRFVLPASWSVSPEILSFNISTPFTEKAVSVNVIPPPEESTGSLEADILVGERSFQHSRISINYSHVAPITMYSKAELMMVRSDLKRSDRVIGYVMGSGDDIPSFLTQIGYRVVVLSDDDLQNKDLVPFDTIVTGIRAFNTRDVLVNQHSRLMKYVNDGGCLVVQYNVSGQVPMENIGPYPFNISRNRVSEESALVTMIRPDHFLLNFPNRIRSHDFSGWVQERGLNFCDSWDNRYEDLLACHDQGEEDQSGGLLSCTFGKGIFIYTGYSFFRQLPAGIPGAFKLFINLIEAGQRR